MAPVSNLTGIGEQTVNPQPSATPYTAMSLGDWCRLHQEPYREIAQWNQTFTVKHSLDNQAGMEVFQFERPKMFAGRASGVSVAGDGFLCTADHHLIYEALGAANYKPAKDLDHYCLGSVGNKEFLIALGAHAPPVSRECIYFGGLKNFGHYIFQNLARLALLNWLPELQHLPIAVHDDLPPRYLGFLDMLGFPADRRIPITRQKPTRFEKLWVLSSPIYRHSPLRVMLWPDAIWWLRLKTASQMRPTNVIARPRLYILRGQTEWRRLINENRVLDLMAKYGIDPVDLSALEAEEQVKAVSNAELIISVLGAGSAISAFAPPDCGVVELAPPDFAATFGPIAFAAMYGQPHFRLGGRPATPAETAQANLPALTSKLVIDRDFFIDCEELERILGLADAYCRRQMPLGDAMPPDAGNRR